MSYRSKRLLTLALAVGVAACTTVGPDYERPDLETGSGWIDREVGEASFSDMETWWASLQDDELSRLMDEAMTAATEVRIAEARRTRAAALVRMAGADFRPSADVSAGATAERQSLNANPAIGAFEGLERDQATFAIGAATSWELDLFGGGRRSREAAFYRYQAADELVRDGFEVMVYTSDDPIVARELEALGCSAVMPLGSLIGSGHGLLNPANLALIVDNASVPVLVDGSQSAVHMPVDVQDLGCDFYCFTGHKVYGPSGIGVLWGKMELLEKMAPFNGGGEMILDVTEDGVTYNAPPHRFEAGTPPIVQAIGLGAATGPLIGGLGVSAFGWRVLFFGTLTVICLLFVAAWRFLPDLNAERARQPHRAPRRPVRE